MLVWRNYCIFLLLGLSALCLGAGRKKFEIGNRFAGSILTPTIVNGADASKNEYPWQVAIKYGSQYICGGSIIHNTLILTAGHCVDFDPDQMRAKFTVIAGDHYTKTNESTEQTVSVNRTVLHTEYDKVELFNDIALLHLTTPLTVTPSVQPTKLSNKNLDKKLSSNKNCYVSGFGVYTQGEFNRLPTTLQELRVKVISNKRCNTMLKRYKFNVTSNMICTNNRNKGICSGDSGGPVGCFDTANIFRQIGIVSWGPRASCNVPPAVYTRVSKYTNWIRKNSF